MLIINLGRKKGCHVVMFEIFTIKHKHNNFLKKNKRKPTLYVKIHNFTGNQAFDVIFSAKLNYTSFYKYKSKGLENVEK